MVKEGLKTRIFRKKQARIVRRVYTDFLSGKEPKRIVKKFDSKLKWKSKMTGNNIGKYPAIKNIISFFNKDLF